MKNLKFAKIGAVAAALTLGLAACSGGTSDSQSSETATNTPADYLATDLSSISEVPEISALVPEEIKADGKLTVGNNIYYAPAEFYASDGKTMQGYDIDMTKALAKVLGLEAEIQQAEFAAIIPAVGSKYEAGIASFTIKPERIEAVNMIKYFEIGSSWSVQKGNPKNIDPANMCGLVIGVQTGTWQDEVINEINKSCAADNQIQIQQYNEQSAVTTALAGGKLDAMYTDSSIAAYAQKITDGATEVLGDPQDVGGVGIVVAKDNEAMTEAMQKALQYLMDQGELEKIFKTWGIEEGVATEAVLNPVD